MTSNRHLHFSIFCAAAIAAFHGPWAAWANLSLHDHRYSHLIIVPVISAVMVYLKRARIFEAPTYSLAAAIPLVAIGVLVSLAGAGLSVIVAGLTLILAAGFLCCYGLASFRKAISPLLFLLVMVPIPTSVLEAATRVLQRGSGEVTYVLFRLIGVPVFRDGFQFGLPGITIEIAEQCSSIRSATALMITGILVGYFLLRSPWTRICLGLLTIPIAMFTNAIRIVTLSSLASYVNRSFLFGKLHHEGGALFSLISIALLIVALRLLQRAERRRALHLAALLPA